MLHPTRLSRALLAAACVAALGPMALAPARAQDSGQDSGQASDRRPLPGGTEGTDLSLRRLSPPDPFAAGTQTQIRTQQPPPETVADGSEQQAPPLSQAEQDLRAQQDERLPPPGALVDVPSKPTEEEDLLAVEADPYAPLGVRIGSFLLFPRIEGGALHTDNVFLTKTAPKADSALYYAPGLTFNSTWSRHEVSGEVKARRSYYDKFSSENDREFSALLRGRLDVTERTKIESELLHSIDQEDRDDFGFPEGAIDRADITTDSVALKGSHTFNRLTVSLRGSITQEDYGEFQLFGDTVTESGASRDNTVDEIEARTSYELKEGVSAFVDWAVNDLRFRHKVNDSGTRNGSSGYAIQGGLAFALTDWLTGEMSAGYARQTPDDPANNVIQGFLLNGDLFWHVTPLTTVSFSALSDIDATVIDASGSFSRLYEIGVEHALRRNIVLGAALSYRTETDADTDDVTRYWTTSLTAEYLLNRWLGIKGEYAHTKSIGELSTDDYTENMVTLGVTVRR